MAVDRQKGSGSRGSFLAGAVALTLAGVLSFAVMAWQAPLFGVIGPVIAALLGPSRSDREVAGVSGAAEIVAAFLISGLFASLLLGPRIGVREWALRLIGIAILLIGITVDGIIVLRLRPMIGDAPGLLLLFVVVLPPAVLAAGFMKWAGVPDRE